MNLTLRLVVFAEIVLFGVFSSFLARGDDDIAQDVAELSPAVLAGQWLDRAEGMVREDLNRRIEAANERSTADWRKIDGRGSWEAFRDQRLAALRAGLGDFPDPPAEMAIRVTGTVEGEGYVIRNLVYESRPGLWVTANLYLPARRSGPMPGILISHSHHRPKEQGEIQDMGMTWARAGCAVLAPDHLGHGERRQHPFAAAADYDGEFAVSRQDYYFRYDSGMQLHLLGDSLMGWLAWDLMRGVDVLLAQEGIDREKIILLGAVAGGGDPCAVAAALDARIACACPFNFGGPQPESRYPLPADAEDVFNYAGGGSWESTRNLTGGAAAGFLPWAIVGSIAPRRLIYAHEFNWDNERDPVWKRFQTIYGFYDAEENLASLRGRGSVRGSSADDTHCTNIGRHHRQFIHPPLEKWFGIEVEEFSARREADELRCMTARAETELAPRRLVDILPALADERLKAARERVRSAERPRAAARGEWAKALGDVTVPRWRAAREQTQSHAGFESRRVVLELQAESIFLPVLLLVPHTDDGRKPPVVVGIAQAGKAGFLEQQSGEIAALLAAEIAVCLPDFRGCGETKGGDDRDQYSADTGRSSTELMLGATMVGARLKDLRAVMAYLRRAGAVDGARIALWGDSFADVNPPDARIAMPRRIDGRPRPCEPLGGLLAMLGAVYEDDVQGVYVRGGLVDFRSVLTSQFVLLPHDAVIPGALEAGDLPLLAESLAPLPLQLSGMVDQRNQPAAAADASRAYADATARYRAMGAEAEIVIGDEPTSPAAWLARQLAFD